MLESKALQLGVIILAIQSLRKLGISLPKLVSSAAARLGLSRKTGYQSAREILEILESRRAAAPEEDLRREIARLRIKVQILSFERDHREVRFSQRHSHLPPEARSLCVRLLRDFRGEVPENDIAATIGIPLSSLKRWDGEADPECRFPEKPDRRGHHRRASAEDVQRVIEEYQKLDRSMPLEEFTERFNSHYPEHTLDRRTITRILQAHGEREIETRGEDKPYHPSFKIYFPGAQIAVDATETPVEFTSAPDDPVKVKKELGIDIASGTIFGDAVRKEETADGVERVVVEARKECRRILAALSDNGPANRSERIQRLTERETEVGQIFSFPYHPETNGHVEGVFGQFSRIVGPIVIDDRSRETIAVSVATIVWGIYIYFHNYSPRKRLGGLSPIEYLRRYAPMPAEVDAAREGLQKRRRRSEELRREHPRLSQPEFRELVDGVRGRHRFEVELGEAMKALLRYDDRVIQSASNAFFVASKRDGFDERKRTFAYFMGIVKNKQKEIDAERIRTELECQNTERLRAQGRESERERQRDRAQEIEDLRSHPEQVVLKYARKLLICRLRYMRRTLGEGLRSALVSLLKRGRGSRAHLEELAGAIRSWGEFGEELKAEMVALLFATYDEVARAP